MKANLKRAEALQPHGRLLCIDIMRGIAALAVVLYHAGGTGSLLRIHGLMGPDAVGKLLLLVSSYCYTGVFLFFVISGFCIHLRVAKSLSEGRDSPLDFVGFWKRRIRRLYPPYLVALATYELVAACSGQRVVSRFYWWNLLLHLLMLHNLDRRTVYTLNGVFWTLAIEEQLYLAYFLLLPMRRRFGWRRAIAVCLLCRLAWFAIAFAAHRLLRAELVVQESWLSNWFIWALGGLSVEAFFGIVKLPGWTRKWTVVLSLLLCAAVLTYLDRLAGPFSNLHRLLWLVITPVWGLAFFVAINTMVALESQWQKSGASRPLKWMGTLGLMSYSLYLTHELALPLVSSWLGNLGLSSGIQTTLLVLLGLPASIAFAYVFFRLFERPFMSTPVQHRPASPKVSNT